MEEHLMQHCCKPVGNDGLLVLEQMNEHHANMAAWGFEHLRIDPQAHILDIGCGGGANIALMLKSTQGMVEGLDYSEVSVQKSGLLNEQAVKEGRCLIHRGEVSNLPFADTAFDLVTAFETIYFWPRIVEDFCEVYRVLKPGGLFFICNEDNGHAVRQAGIIKGMNLYDDQKIKNLLIGAGFSEIEISTKYPEDWVCALAVK
ncbi:class I SAM-dependent methyltransferase [bacterium]|nr:class I SAM-dependent methyltransferase [bacterium]